MPDFYYPPNDLPDAPAGPVLFTPIQLSNVQPALTPAMLRDLVKASATNGYAKAVHRINGKTLIDIVEFYRVLKAQQKSRLGGAA